MHLQIAIVGIGFARQKCFQLAAGNLDFQTFQRRLSFSDRLVVLLRLAEFDERKLVLKLLLDAANGLELIIKRVTLAHDALRSGLIVPEIGVF